MNRVRISGVVVVFLAPADTIPRLNPEGDTLHRWLVFVLLAAAPVQAQEKKPLRWGTDPAGGAPYVYTDKTAAAEKYIGFEVELAEYLAGKLDRTSAMVKGDWSKLPLLLRKPADQDDAIDIVLNGYELRKDLLADYAATRPYYVYRLVMMTHAETAKDKDLRGWADLYPSTGRAVKTVGVLGGSVAHRHVKKTFAEGVSVKTSEDVKPVLDLVLDRRMDATVQDNPCATYFLKQYPDLVAVGEPVKPGFYVIYYRKDDPALGAALDKAIAEGLRDGSLRKIYAKYHVWNDDQERLWYWLEQPWPPEDIEDEDLDEDGHAVNPWPRLLKELIGAAGVTVLLSVVSFPIAMVAGLLIAVGRVYGPRWLGFPLGLGAEIVRGTPLLLQLFVIYYLIPELMFQTRWDGLIWLAKNLTPFLAGVLGLALNYSAYESENYRAGLLAIPKGQMEAALALGMTRFTAIRRIVVPQAVRLVIPPVTNDFIALFKDTSACSVILVVELTRKYNELYNFNRDLIVELAFVTAGLYLLMSYPLSIVANRFERRLNAPAGGR